VPAHIRVRDCAVESTFIRREVIDAGVDLDARRYDLQAIVDDPDLPGDYVSADTRGYFRHYWEYLNS
jgi:hypothetical protein